MTAATPPFPEAALRAVLAGAVAAWSRGDAASAGDEPRRWYVDAFAGAEFQFGTGVARDAGDESRAAAALRALDERATAVLVEEDPAHLTRLYGELEDAVGGERLRATRDLALLAPGEVSLAEAPFAAVAGDLSRIATGARPFVFLAPPAARALPWDALRPLAALAQATLLIRIPFSDFEKQARYDTPVADLPGFARRIVEGCSAMLGDAQHAWLPAWRAAAASGGIAAAMDGVLERFAARLEDTARGRGVKPLVLETPEGAPAYLFLVTADPAVATAVDAAVRATRLKDRAAPADPAPFTPPPAPPAEVAAPPRSAKKTKPAKARTVASPPAEPPQPIEAAAAEDPAPAVAVPRVELPAEAPSPEPATPPRPAVPTPRAESPAGPPSPAPATPPAVTEPLDLFPEDLPPPEPSRPDAAALAASVAAHFAGRTVAWRDVLGAFAGADVTLHELKKALALLRRGGRAVYKPLKGDDDPIEFPVEPAPELKPKPARHRKAADAGWFGEEE